jgi:hypothetical protein
MTKKIHLSSAISPQRPLSVGDYIIWHKYWWIMCLIF